VIYSNIPTCNLASGLENGAHRYWPLQEPRLKKARRRQALSDSDEEGQMSPHRSPPSDVEPVAEVRRRHSSPGRSRLRKRQLSESESE